ncbi:hypothetical protein VNI00_019377 [Paramarasmius palmivorus]|uniref:Uncharacterized protein n=1 Tax=Paramarasmius palmivorus TaxID=297713 RepID=A0AAW0AM16_9AGAR
MDSQDIVAWGRVDKERYFEERERLGVLCDWGQEEGKGVDGFVRMEMDFEIMLCDFTAGVRVESMLNLEEIKRGRVGPPLHAPSTNTNAEVRMDIEVIRAGARHNHFPGETRVKLDYTKFISFYDTDLVPSLVDVRARMNGRLEHRLEGISARDIGAVMGRLNSAFSGSGGSGSGVDWQTLIKVVKDRYAERLELVRDLVNLNETTVKKAGDVQGQLTAMVAPYLLASPNFNATYKLCATTHTRYIRETLAMTPSEKLLLGAVEGTTKEICRSVIRMWSWGVDHDDGDVEELLGAWKEEIERLMNWLDWSVWLKCRPGCNWDEMCYLPTWPMFRWGPGGRPGPPGRGPPPPEDVDEDEEPDWIDPQPVCRKIVGEVDF